MLICAKLSQWGDAESAPDDKENATLSGGNIYYFRQEQYSNTSEINQETVPTNLTINEAHKYIEEHVSPSAFKPFPPNPAKHVLILE